VKERHLIGFSLSCCIADICNGKVDIEEVLFIQTGCSPRNSDEVDGILKTYQEIGWRGFREKAIEVFNQLLHDEDHPRIGWASTYVKNCVPIYWGHWLSMDHRRIDFEKEAQRIWNAMTDDFMHPRLGCDKILAKELQDLCQHY
jgi:hypothetical protein